jgi:hypothetical protein
MLLIHNYRKLTSRKNAKQQRAYAISGALAIPLRITLFSSTTTISTCFVVKYHLGIMQANLETGMILRERYGSRRRRMIHE